MSTTPTPYAFADLPKLTKEQVVLANWLCDGLDFLSLSSDLKQDLEQLLKNTLQVDATIQALAPTLATPDMASPNCFATLAIPPHAGTLFLELDPRLVKSVIYKVLGDVTKTPEDGIKISAAERGIFSFMGLKILQVVQTYIDANLGLRLQWISLGQETKPASPMVCMGFSIQLAELSSFARLWLPKETLGALQKIFVSKTTLPASEKIRVGLRRSLGLNLPLVVELGRVSLKPKEIASLEVEDIIVLEESVVHLKEPGLVGNVMCQLGDPTVGSVKGRLILTKSGRYAVQVLNIFGAHTPESKGSLTPSS